MNQVMTTSLGKPKPRFPTMVSMIIFCIALVIPLQAIASTHNALIYGYRCTGSTNNSASSTNKASPFYIYNLYNLLGSFTTQAIKSGYYNSSLGESPNRVYALYMCRFDTDAQSCSTCVNEAKNQILKACPFQTEAIIWYENCMLHYSQSSFFGKMIISPWLLLSKPQNISKNHIADFTEIMLKSMKKLVNSTAYNSKSPVKMFQTTVVNVTGVGELFELALCFPDLSHSDCFRCLSIAIERLVISVDSRVLLPTCAVWYQTSLFSASSENTTYPFYNSSSVAEQTVAQKRKRTSSSVVIVAISVPIVIAILLLWSACSCIYRHNYKPTKHSSDLEDIVGIESLQFNFKIIKDATNNFAFGNKLGQGGFGEVYKGTLVDGKEIAVKRLSINSGQGVAEFKTEIILAANLQHNNLVKILGFCLYGEEKLIIYEFCPNASLDKVLFGRIRRPLDWEIRYKILLGTARGLLYLHEDSRLTIIHRDLKPSNILLDESMNPKISDFGLARLVGRDQNSQIGTSRIAGTYGYMAPEYALTGRFSVMSDVYSFGVIILEVVSGHMCSSTMFPYDKESLCLRAWSLWKDNATLDLVDPKLDGVFPIEEAMKCIHIGLLCIQEDAIKRPSMATFLLALNGHHVDLAEPEPPLKGPSTINSNRFARNERQIYSKEFSSYFDDMTEIYPR